MKSTSARSGPSRTISLSEIVPRYCVRHRVTRCAGRVGIWSDDGRRETSFRSTSLSTIQSKAIYPTLKQRRLSVGGHFASARMRREPVFCLSFATLAVFLGRNYTFDSTLTQTRLSLRRTGLTDNTVLSNDFEWGLHERQRTKQTNTGVEVKKEADRDNEAKSTQTNQWADLAKFRV